MHGTVVLKLSLCDTFYENPFVKNPIRPPVDQFDRQECLPTSGHLVEIPKVTLSSFKLVRSRSGKPNQRKLGLCEFSGKESGAGIANPL